MVGSQTGSLKVEELFSQLTGPAEAKAKGKSALPVLDENAEPFVKLVCSFPSQDSSRVARIMNELVGVATQLSLCAGWSLLPNGLPQELISNTCMSTKVGMGWDHRNPIWAGTFVKLVRWVEQSSILALLASRWAYLEHKKPTSTSTHISWVTL